MVLRGNARLMDSKKAHALIARIDVCSCKKRRSGSDTHFVFT